MVTTGVEGAEWEVGGVNMEVREVAAESLWLIILSTVGDIKEAKEEVLHEEGEVEGRVIVNWEERRLLEPFKVVEVLPLLRMVVLDPWFPFIMEFEPSKEEEEAAVVVLAEGEVEFVASGRALIE